jgi:hypothetical protein
MSETTLQTVEQLALRLDAREQLALVEHLVHHLRTANGTSAPEDLYGAWAAKFSPDLNLDEALAEIRSAWQRSELP